MKTLPMSKITMFAFAVLIITVIAAPHQLLEDKERRRATPWPCWSSMSRPGSLR